MYSSSDGQKLSPLPDLDEHRLPPREKLKRKYKGSQTQQHECVQVGSSQSGFQVNHCHSAMINYTTEISSLSSKANPSITSNRQPRKGRKRENQLLSDAQKRANHIASEQKRRLNIRIGYDQLVDIVPTLSHCHKSESLILQKSYDYIQQLLNNKTSLKDRIQELQVILGETPDEVSSEDDGEYIV